MKKNKLYVAVRFIIKLNVKYLYISSVHIYWTTVIFHVHKHQGGWMYWLQWFWLDLYLIRHHTKQVEKRQTVCRANAENSYQSKNVHFLLSCWNFHQLLLILFFHLPAESSCHDFWVNTRHGDWGQNTEAGSGPTLANPRKGDSSSNSFIWAR